MTRTSKRAVRPGFDDLEGRGLLSGLMVGGTNMAAIGQPPVTPPEQTPLTLSGTITGGYTSIPPPLPLPGMGMVIPAVRIYRLLGNGPITIMPPGGNPVTLSAQGFINLPTGFTPPGHVAGTLTLSDPQGTLTLTLTGPLFSDVPGPFQPLLQRGFSPLPDQFDRFDYEITGGTGAFAKATGRGTAFLQLVADPNLSGQRGRFSLDLEGRFSPVPPRDAP